MVKDFKYIIKRILIGTGIAILLMLFKGQLAYNVSAKSCSESNVRIVHPYSNTITGQIHSTDATNPTPGGFIWTGSSDYYDISFGSSDSDYMIIEIPFSYSINNQDNTPTDNTQFSGSVSIPIIAFYENTKNANNNVKHFAYYENGFIKIRFNKKDYNGYNYIRFRGLMITPPNFYYNFGSVNMWFFANNYWFVHDYSCDDNAGVQKAIEDTNDTLKDDSVDDNKTSSSIDNMKGKVATNGSISQLLTLPITLYQNILNSLSGGCSSFNLGSLFGSNLTMPCINLQNLLGSTLYGIIDVLISGLFILSFRKKMVDIFNHMTSLNDRGNELE